MHKGLMGAIMAAAIMGAPAIGDRAAIMPRRQEAPRPPASRDERKKRQRRFGSLPKKLRHGLNRAYVAHERGSGDSPLCRPGWTLPFGPHRIAELEPVMCNDCQRARWKLDQSKRRGA